MTIKPAVASGLIAAQACALLLLAPAPAHALKPHPPSEWVVGSRNRVALLTFDGRTTRRNLNNLLASLKSSGVKASFFFPGAWVADHKKEARSVRAAGHVLGNRGWGVKRFTDMSDDTLRASITKAELALRKVGASPRPFLRPPAGARDLRVLRVAGSMGYRSVRWTVHPGNGISEKLARRVVRRVQPGSIISLDLARISHRNAVDDIVRGLKRKSFALRTIENLVYAHAVRWDVTVASESSGPEVVYLQKKLKAISYPAGKPDGTFGYETLQGVYAFEKFNRLQRDGSVGPEQMRMIALATRPSAPKRGPKKFVDVDISRQVLREVVKGRVKRTLPISSGNEQYYEQDGELHKAHTPRGDFVIERKITGWRESDLGKLWYPSYFVGGYAIHGSESVPTYPASHGCVRIPMYVTKGFYYRNPIGTPTFVHN